MINARHMRNVPGRKTDVGDAQWGARLIEHGLVRPSFIPPRPTREQRDLTRYRKSVIEERGREVQRLHKVLEDAGVKLSSVASSVLTKSGREMIDSLIVGQRDPDVLAEMARGGMRSKIVHLQDAMAGRFNDHHALLCRAMLARIDQADATINELTVLSVLEDPRTLPRAGPEEGSPPNYFNKRRDMLSAMAVTPTDESPRASGNDGTPPLHRAGSSARQHPPKVGDRRQKFRVGPRRIEFPNSTTSEVSEALRQLRAIAHLLRPEPLYTVFPTDPRAHERGHRRLRSTASDFADIGSDRLLYVSRSSIGCSYARVGARAEEIGRAHV